MITRQQYMSGEATHRQYYLEVAIAAGVKLDKIYLDHVRRCLPWDEHLNNIPLNTWDVLALGYRGSISRELKARGDFWSDAGGVCTMKAYATHLAAQVRYTKAPST